MFFRYPDIPRGALTEERADKVEKIVSGLPEAEIVFIERKNIVLRLPDGEEVEGDVAPSGFTVYLGGFDWVTFPNPPHLLQKFPQFMPLPQAPLIEDEDDLLPSRPAL